MAEIKNGEIEINEYTKRVVKLAMEIGQAAKDNDKEGFIGSGLAIDLSLGRISRDHHDIDFHPMLEDAQWWREWFTEKGYKVVKRKKTDYPDAYKVVDNEGEEVVDLWPIKLEEEKLLINHNGEFVDSNKRWSETRVINYQGVDIRVENPERVLEQKAKDAKNGKPMRPQDIHDFKLLGRSI